jgi:hypothetical protein
VIEKLEKIKNADLQVCGRIRQNEKTLILQTFVLFVAGLVTTW